LNYFTKAMVGITGHYVDHTISPEDVGGLSKIGLSICFASLLAALQFGIAGWFLSENLGLFAQTLISITTGIVGALVVLIIDRSFIYASDTRADSGGKLGYFYLAIRIFLILAVGSLSSQFVLPLMLKSELAIHIQDLKDLRYEEAKNRYNEKYSVTEKVSTEQSIQSSVTKLKAELDNPPPSLIRQKLEAQNCLLDYKRKINSSIGPDVEFNEVANLFAADKAECDRLNLTYKEAYQAYFNPRKAALAQNVGAHSKAQEEATTAQALLKTDLTRTDQNNEQYLNMSSADVLWDLVKNNPGARSKYLLITTVQLVLELMPLLLKSLLGRSPLGIRVAMRINDIQNEYHEAEHRHELNQVERLVKATTAQNEQRLKALDDEIAIQEKKNHLTSLRVDKRNRYLETKASSLFNWGAAFGSKKTNKYEASSKPRAEDRVHEGAQTESQGASFVDPKNYAAS